MLSKAQKAISEMEEKIKMLTVGNSKMETFPLQPAPKSSYQTQNTSGQAYKHPGAPYTRYRCGMTGHMARLCPDKTSGRATRNPAGTTILFPGDNGPQRMIWVDYPPNRLALGYYPLEPLPQGENRHRTPHNRFQADSNNENQEPASAGGVRELKEVTDVDIASSAAESMLIGRDVVQYVNAVEDAFVTGHRRRADTDGVSSDAPRGRRDERTNQQTLRRQPPAEWQHNVS